MSQIRQHAQQKSDIFNLQEVHDKPNQKITKNYQKSSIFEQKDQQSQQVQENIFKGSEELKVLNNRIPLVTQNKSNIFNIEEEQQSLNTRIRETNTTHSQILGCEGGQENVKNHSELFQKKKQTQTPQLQEKQNQESGQKKQSKNCAIQKPQDAPHTHIFGDHVEPPVKKQKGKDFTPKYPQKGSPQKQLQESLQGQQSADKNDKKDFEDQFSLEQSHLQFEKNQVAREENLFNAQWWNQGAEGKKCQVNENAVFEKDYHRKKNFENNKSPFFQPDLHDSEQSQRPQTANISSQVNEKAIFDQSYHQNRKQLDNQSQFFGEQVRVDEQKFQVKKKEIKKAEEKAWEERKNDRNYSDLFGFERPKTAQESSGQKKNLQQNAIPSNLNVFQHDSNIYGIQGDSKKEYNSVQKHFDNLKSVLDNHSYEAEFLRGQPIKQKKKEEKFLNGQVVEKTEQEQEKEKLKFQVKETEPIPENRVALFRQKQEKENQNVLIYEIEVKGLNEKVDSVYLRKFFNSKGYHLIDIKADINKTSQKPTGRGKISLRNNKKKPESIDTIKAFLQSQGINVVSVTERELSKKDLVTKKENSTEQSKNLNTNEKTQNKENLQQTLSEKQDSSKIVEIGSESNKNDPPQKMRTIIKKKKQ